MMDPLSYFSFLPSWIGVVAFGDVEMNVKRTSASGHMADLVVVQIWRGVTSQPVIVKGKTSGHGFWNNMLALNVVPFATRRVD